jgi:hypothetical protein
VRWLRLLILQSPKLSLSKNSYWMCSEIWYELVQLYKVVSLYCELTIGYNPTCNFFEGLDARGAYNKAYITDYYGVSGSGAHGAAAAAVDVPAENCVGAGPWCPLLAARRKRGSGHHPRGGPRYP